MIFFHLFFTPPISPILPTHLHPISSPVHHLPFLRHSTQQRKHLRRLPKATGAPIPKLIPNWSISIRIRVSLASDLLNIPTTLLARVLIREINLAASGIVWVQTVERDVVLGAVEVQRDLVGGREGSLEVSAGLRVGVGAEGGGLAVSVAVGLLVGVVVGGGGPGLPLA